MQTRGDPDALINSADTQTNGEDMQIFQNIRTNDGAKEPSNIEVNNSGSSARTPSRMADLVPSQPQSLDTSAISPTASMLALALSEGSPGDAHVQQITSSISSGTYKVDSAVLASSIMDTMVKYPTE